MEVLGHSRIAVTSDIYTHVVPAVLGDAADAMDAALGGQFGGQEAEGDVEAQLPITRSEAKERGAARCGGGPEGIRTPDLLNTMPSEDRPARSGRCSRRSVAGPDGPHHDDRIRRWPTPWWSVWWSVPLGATWFWGGEHDHGRREPHRTTV